MLPTYVIYSDIKEKTPLLVLILGGQMCLSVCIPNNFGIY